ncbi:MAG: hydroxyacid dehydrogenase [Candidatus Helarchaeota archaeon]
MSPRVLILDGVHENCARMLRENNLEVEEIPEITPEELKAKLADVHAIVVRSKTKITKELIDAAPNLKIIARAGVGLDNIDVEYAKKRQIKVVNAEEAPSVTVAELVMGLIITLLRNIAIADHLMKKGKWAKSHLRGMELRGKTIGIIGAGRIGIEVLKRSRAFEMNPIVFDISKEQLEKARALGAKVEPNLDALLQKADIITIHIPLTPETKNLINEEKIKLMKDGAFLINAARGGIVDEKALYNALIEGKLTGAGLDCYEEEPSPNTDLINLPNVVCTPHLGASTEEAQRTAAYLIAKKIIEHLC